jgi:hypothetical protein
MEFLELLGPLLEGSCCLLEILAGAADVGAAYSGTRARRTFDRNRAARASGEDAPRVPTVFWVFLVLLILGTILTVWVFLKWLPR